MLKFNKVFRKPKYLIVQNNQEKSQADDNKELNINSKPVIPNGLWLKCSNCGETIYTKDLSSNNKVCLHCGQHNRMTAQERLESLMDTGTFKEINADMLSVNPLQFKQYEEKLKSNIENNKMNEAVVSGYGKIYGHDAVVLVMDSNFLMGSMGSVVGEKVTRAVELATQKKWPVIIFTASGGARMQEGIFSLMQMAKTSAALARHNEAGALYISVLTDPTTGGVSASFAMLGDIILAEPGALIGFAGKRVINNTIKQELPEGFQTAEFLYEHGFIDRIIPRKEMKLTLGRILKIHQL